MESSGLDEADGSLPTLEVSAPQNGSEADADRGLRIVTSDAGALAPPPTGPASAPSPPLSRTPPSPTFQWVSKQASKSQHTPWTRKDSDFSFAPPAATAGGATVSAEGGGPATAATLVGSSPCHLQRSGSAPFVQSRLLHQQQQNYRGPPPHQSPQLTSQTAAAVLRRKELVASAQPLGLRKAPVEAGPFPAGTSPGEEMGLGRESATLPVDYSLFSSSDEERNEAEGTAAAAVAVPEATEGSRRTSHSVALARTGSPYAFPLVSDVHSSSREGAAATASTKTSPSVLSLSASGNRPASARSCKAFSATRMLDEDDRAWRGLHGSHGRPPSTRSTLNSPHGADSVSSRKLSSTEDATASSSSVELPSSKGDASPHHDSCSPEQRTAKANAESVFSTLSPSTRGAPAGWLVTPPSRGLEAVAAALAALRDDDDDVGSGGVTDASGGQRPLTAPGLAVTAAAPTALPLTGVDHDAHPGSHGRAAPEQLLDDSPLSGRYKRNEEGHLRLFNAGGRPGSPRLPGHGLHTPDGAPCGAVSPLDSALPPAPPLPVFSMAETTEDNPQGPPPPGPTALGEQRRGQLRTMKRRYLSFFYVPGNAELRRKFRRVRIIAVFLHLLVVVCAVVGFWLTEAFLGAHYEWILAMTEENMVEEVATLAIVCATIPLLVPLYFFVFYVGLHTCLRTTPCWCFFAACVGREDADSGAGLPATHADSRKAPGCNYPRCGPRDSATHATLHPRPPTALRSPPAAPPTTVQGGEAQRGPPDDFVASTAPFPSRGSNPSAEGGAAYARTGSLSWRSPAPLGDGSRAPESPVVANAEEGALRHALSESPSSSIGSSGAYSIELDARRPTAVTPDPQPLDTSLPTPLPDMSAPSREEAHSPPSHVAFILEPSVDSGDHPLLSTQAHGHASSSLTVVAYAGDRCESGTGPGSHRSRKQPRCSRRLSSRQGAFHTYFQSPRQQQQQQQLDGFEEGTWCQWCCSGLYESFCEWRCFCHMNVTDSDNDDDPYRGLRGGNRTVGAEMPVAAGPPPDSQRQRRHRQSVRLARLLRVLLLSVVTVRGLYFLLVIGVLFADVAVSFNLILGIALLRLDDLSWINNTVMDGERTCQVLQINGRCSGWRSLCNAPAMTREEAAAQWCPYCPETQARVAALAFAQTCHSRFESLRYGANSLFKVILAVNGASIAAAAIWMTLAVCTGTYG